MEDPANEFTNVSLYIKEILINVLTNNFLA